jgi:hypothetical protein
MISVTTITETEFSRICREIRADSEQIVRDNPIGTSQEVMLWMLLGILVSFLSLSELETPCFTGKPDAETYRNAIRFVLKDRMNPKFDPEPYLDLFE